MNRSSDPPHDDDVILTGIARSGTTLACTLLNRLPDTVALHEPIAPRMLLGLPSHDAVVGRIGEFFAAQRRTLLARGEAVSRVIDGRIPDNPYSAEADGKGLRRSVVKEGTVRFDKRLSRDFRLVIKHPSCFTAILASLVCRYPCFAIVRNPLAILLSWQTTAANWNDGRQSMAEAFDDTLRRRLDNEPDPVRRQVLMVAWSFEQYARHLPAEAVIRYEDLVASPGATLSRIVPGAMTLEAPLENRNASRLYRGVDVRGLAARLLESSGAQWDFYPRESIPALATQLDPATDNP